ncbi:hypothetical protein A2630_02155 [Candidatus Woesebacteria bacterium RIFCSPHIGHO2_01_FULL_44_10]|uniref:Glycosyltransferase RgtA/B/C/D-like domain-containing protein n=1 Tax=Candidatus Woesebacteria bacterium RIFCSPLOWO2_01_FULL_44_14 TaxID=1802525 RepID=A0A1F8C092_9BACT|nr:MAG: hypothetical protein A2630_02155 [Candidatus Woesebacteria bacterium RIFCSPHIGHO2_01_FULL_44_10]OGM55773.1 MAG: hypothetical protein A3F62_04010 [Candidatus Woesebacteria bacterium RIFCSPHIGHO2_12_FULL_44_11]OGM68968.1 MAG: hypothetical protein A2975_02130 [Candidatus Woesebacteria bacterium RIFCSPLOWO2_01_FULL_44_14]
MQKVLIIFLTSRLTFILFAFLASYFTPLVTGYLGQQYDPALPRLAWVWANFDGMHYLSIADNGYAGDNFAFFPLYPFLINLTAYLIPISKLYLGLTISWTALLGSLILIHKIIRLDYSEKIATRALILLSFFPMAFFYQSVYAESLFLLVSTTSFYLLRKQKWFASGIFGTLALASRPFAIALLPALLIEAFPKNKKVFLTIFLAGLGLLAYLAYQQIAFGDFLLFQKSLVGWEQDRVVLIPQTIYRYFKIFAAPGSLQAHWVSYVEFICVFAYFWLSFWVFKKIRKSYGVFMITLMLIVTGLGTFTSVPRYLTSMFPGFLGLSVLFKNRVKFSIVLIIFLILGFIFTAYFSQGVYVA